MGVQYRKAKSIGKGSRVNVSGSRRGAGVSVSQRVGRLTLNSRGTGSLRIMPGLSFRFGKRNDPVSAVLALVVVAIVVLVRLAFVTDRARRRAKQDTTPDAPPAIEP